MVERTLLEDSDVLALVQHFDLKHSGLSCIENKIVPGSDKQYENFHL